LVDAAAGLIVLVALESSQRVVDPHVLLQAGALLRRGHFEHAVEREVHVSHDLVAGRDFGEPLDTELADQGVAANIVVLALIDLHVDHLLPVHDGQINLAARGG